MPGRKTAASKRRTNNYARTALTANAFEGLARYEVHLDRKLERTLAMLLKLKDLRREVLPG